MSDDWKERDEEAQRMRDAGHEEAAAAHLMEAFVDDDGEIKDAQARDEAEMIEEMGKLRDDHYGGVDDDDDEGYAETVSEADDADSDEPEGDGTDEADEDGPARLELDDDTLDSLVTIKVQGEEIDVPLREALGGTMRHADYTRKTSELAEQRREVQAIRAQHEEMIETYLAGDNLTPGQRQAFQANYQAIQQDKAREAQSALQKRAKEEQAKLVEAMGWDEAKPEAVKSEQAELRATAEAYGYTAGEVTASLDHRAILMLRDAMKFRQMNAKGEQVRKKAKKAGVTLKPGSTTTRGSSEKRAKAEAMKSLSKTGSLQDAAAAFEALGLAD